MNVKELITDDDAVSPVIGVILMVAITVILAAVIGAFVLNLGATQATAPTVTWEWSQSSGVDVKLTHGGGDKVDTANLDAEGASCVGSPFPTTNPEWTAGDSTTVATGCSDGDKIDIVWNSPKGSDSQIIAEYTVN